MVGPAKYINPPNCPASAQCNFPSVDATGTCADYSSSIGNYVYGNKCATADNTEYVPHTYYCYKEGDVPVTDFCGYTLRFFTRLRCR